MSAWTHLVRFVAVEDNQVHLGQLVDATRDAGRDSADGREIAVYVIDGTIFDGRVTDQVLHVKSLLSPVSRKECSYVRCLRLNYIDHAKVCLCFTGGTPCSMPYCLHAAETDVYRMLGSKSASPKVPILFTKPRMALSGPYPAAINVPKCAQDGTSDYKAELCLVIGKSGRDIPEERALDHVLGYTASNDVSVRTLQLLTAQWSFSKGLDGSCPIGPVLVSHSVIEDPQSLSVKAIYNNQTVQNGHTLDMISSIKKQISYLPQGTTLEAGTVILTGTPAGIGYFRQPRVVLQDGDEVCVKIDKIGTLINRARYDSR